MDGWMRLGDEVRWMRAVVGGDDVFHDATRLSFSALVRDCSVLHVVAGRMRVVVDGTRWAQLVGCCL